ncbi:unnamed protein product, partial [Brassica oleracea]
HPRTEEHPRNLGGKFPPYHYRDELGFSCEIGDDQYHTVTQIRLKLCTSLKLIQ